jgi:Zn-dependent alcohol dehydrogenase
VKVKAAVAWGPKEPLRIEEVDLEGPKAHGWKDQHRRYGNLHASARANQLGL